MQFLNPLALAGLAAALIPLAIHLLHRGKAREIPFSNLAFLHELHQSRMRSVRLRQWLVLLLRMLALACLALAAARPALQKGGGFLSGARPTTAVLLFDHSYSTRYSPPGGRVFDELRHRADELFSLLDGAHDEIYFVPLPLQTGTVSGPLSGEGARQLLADGLPTERATDLSPALRQVRALLDAHPTRHRELYLFTDLATPGWEDVAWESAADLPIFVIAPPEREVQNLYAGPVALADWLAAPGQKLAIHAEIGRWGGPVSAQQTTVDLYIDGERVQQRRVAVPAGEKIAVDFSISPRRSGRLTGFVEIDDDALTADNRRYFTLQVPQRIAVMIAGQTAGDAYYPRRALNAVATQDPTLSVTSIRLDELSAEVIADIDVLILAHVVSPTREQVAVIRQFAATGGGLLIVPGTDADLSRVNRELLADLVPASLTSLSGQPGGTGYVSLDTTRSPSALFAGLLSATEDHPAFHATFELTTRQPLSVLAYFDDGRPALIEGQGPTGHVLLWPTPFDLAWSDLPIRGLFVPLLQRMVRYLAQPAAYGTKYTVGDRAWRRLAGVDADTRVEVESPSGRRLVLQTERLAGERLWKVTDLNEAGIWQLHAGEHVVDAFAVNVDVAEADLTTVAPQLVHRQLGEQVRILGPGQSLRDTVHAARFGRELWRELLMIGGLLLLLELWVGRAPESTPARDGPVHA